MKYILYIVGFFLIITITSVVIIMYSFTNIAPDVGIEKIDLVETTENLVSHEKILGEEDSEIAQDYPDFEKVSILDHSVAGYKLAYPAGYTIDYSIPGKVEVTPPDRAGRVVLYVKGEGIFEVKEFNQGLNEDQALLISATAELIRESFEFLE